MSLRNSSTDEAALANFSEFGKGRTYARTKRKYGKKRADKQRIAVVLNTKRKAARRKRS